MILYCISNNEGKAWVIDWKAWKEDEDALWIWGKQKQAEKEGSTLAAELWDYIVFKVRQAENKTERLWKGKGWS